MKRRSVSFEIDEDARWRERDSYTEVRQKETKAGRKKNEEKNDSLMNGRKSTRGKKRARISCKRTIVQTTSVILTENIFTFPSFLLCELVSLGPGKRGNKNKRHREIKDNWTSAD